MQAAAGLGHEGDPVTLAQVLGAQHRALDELEHECVVLRQRRDEPRADARVGRGDRVVHLVLTVDREQAGVLAGDPYDVGVSPTRRHLVVRVREPARQRLDGRRILKLRNGRQHVVESHAAILCHRERASPELSASPGEGMQIAGTHLDCVCAARRCL